jgi:hypothetical protein
MPQPALHLILAEATLQHWDHSQRAPFDVRCEASRNAFRIGSLAPDLGLFPGGDIELSRMLHRERTGEFARTLLASARNDAESAFAWGWLSHVLADVAIHPLVNAVAAAQSRTGSMTLLDHVRVEVGLDAWLAWQHPTLRRLRLRRFLERDDFLRPAMQHVYGGAPTTVRLMKMQRGMLRFSHLALHFATRVAREVCWDEAADQAPAPLGSAVTWRVVTLLSGRETATYAYLNPVRPHAALLAAVETAVRQCQADLDRWIEAGLQQLPDHDLETGVIVAAARSAA